MAGTHTGLSESFSLQVSKISYRKSEFGESTEVRHSPPYSIITSTRKNLEFSTD